MTHTGRQKSQAPVAQWIGAALRRRRPPVRVRPGAPGAAARFSPRFHFARLAPSYGVESHRAPHRKSPDGAFAVAAKPGHMTADVNYRDDERRGLDVSVIPVTLL